jgi:hypothetical protein
VLAVLEFSVVVYFIHCENEGVPSSVSDVHRYVIIRKLLGSMFNILPGVFEELSHLKYNTV